MNVLTISGVILSFCVGLYLIGMIVSKKGKTDKYVFASGKRLPTMKPKYFSQLYLVILVFLVFDAIVLVVASGGGFNVNVVLFLVLLVVVSVLVGKEMREND